MLFDSFFRNAFFTLFTFLLLIRSYYKIKARVFQFKSIVRSEGIPLFVLRSIPGVFLLIALFFYIFQRNKGAFLELELPIWLRITGIVLGIFSLILLVWSHHSLGKNFATSVMIRKNHFLVKRGPYLVIRPPMYMAYHVLFLSAFFITGNWGIGLSGLCVVIFLVTLRLIKEESNLIRHFGKEYKEYMERVGKFIPKNLFKHRDKSFCESDLSG